MFDDFKKLYAAAENFAVDAVESRIEDARAAIARERRKIRRLTAQKKFFKALVAELSKPPKPYKPPKLTRKEKRQLEGMRRAIPQGAFAVPVASLKQ